MIPIIDMHCDTIFKIYELVRQGEDVVLRRNNLHLDLMRMKEAGYMAQCFALFTYLPYMQERGVDPFEYAKALSDTMDRELEANADLIRPALSAGDIVRNYREGFLSAVKTIEEGAVYKGSPELVRFFYDHGVRKSTLTWNFENELAFPNRAVKDPQTGEYHVFPETEGGLKKAGQDVVQLMEELGILIDVSHLGDAGILEILDLVNTTYANCLGIKEDSQWLDDFMEVYEEGHFSYCVKEGDTYWFAMWEYSTPEYASSIYSNEFRYFCDKFFPDISAADYEVRRGAGFDEWNYHLYYDFTWKDLCDAWLAEMDNWEGHWIHFLYGAYERAEIGNTDEEPGYYQGNWGGPVFIGGKTVLHFPDQYDYYVKDPGVYTVTATIDGCRGTIVSQFVVNTKPGWVQDENGWRWREENGEFARNKWIEDLFDRYYINDDGYMATGLQKIGNDWYCFNENGLLARGWKMVDGKWYFMDYRGIVQTGWKQVSGKWYYLSPSQNGAMVTGLQEVNDKWYYFNASGEMLTGWQQIDSKWYFFDGSGAMLTGWQQLGGVWYYLAPLDNGAMVTGWQSIDGTWYYFNGSGAMLTGWQQLGGVWYYMNPSGAMVTGWQSIGGVWYYFNEGGAMMTGWQSIGGKWYYFNAGGAMVTGWLQLGGVWYYMNPSGAMVTGRQQINGTWYTFSSSGALL